MNRCNSCANYFVVMWTLKPCAWSELWCCDLVAEHGTETVQTVLGRVDRLRWSFQVDVICESKSRAANGVTQIPGIDAREVKRQHNETARGEDSPKLQECLVNVLANERR